MIINENCPCKRKQCERHGKCDECRKHHAEFKRPMRVACEREKKNRRNMSFKEGKDKSDIIRNLNQ